MSRAKAKALKESLRVYVAAPLSSCGQNFDLMMQFKNYFLIFPRLNTIYLTFNKFKNNSHSTAISFHLNQFCLQFRSTALDCFTFFHIQVAYQP